MRKLLILFAILSLTAWNPAAEAKPRKRAVSTAGKSSVKKKTTVKKAASSKRTPTRHGRATARRSTRGQQVPTPDRYREIQSALADRGYLRTEPNGVWGSESVEALKKFQQDQNLRPNGKLDSASLISLGLGPRQTAIEP